MKRRGRECVVDGIKRRRIRQRGETSYIVQRITTRRYRRLAETLDDGIARSFFPWAKLSIMQTAALWEIGLTNVYKSRVCENRFNTVLTYYSAQLSET